MKSAHRFSTAQTLAANDADTYGFRAWRRVADGAETVAQVAVGAAFELDAPLRCMTSCLCRMANILLEQELAAESAGNEELKGALAQARAAAGRASHVASNLRALGARPPAPRQSVDVHRAIDFAFECLAGEINDRAMIELDYGVLPEVKIDADALATALMHVLLNAAQAIPVGSPGHNRIRVRTSVERSDIVIEVADTGTGIEAADMPHIFEPFFTGKPTPTSAGLGLPIACAALEGMRGDISVQSTVGLGTRVRVVFPLAQPQGSGDVARAP